MNITQIQIAPVENGFVIQCVALDGMGGGRKLVATDLEDCRTKLHGLVDEFHVEKPKPPKDVPPVVAKPVVAKPATLAGKK